MCANIHSILLLLIVFSIPSCQGRSSNQPGPPQPGFASTGLSGNPDSIRTIHVMVALCDNRYQGIVPVPSAIGNGQNPDNNLYWGAGYGIRNFFKKSPEWQLVDQRTLPGIHWQDSVILEQLLFRHRDRPVYMLAEAYNGKFIRTTTEDFLEAAAGRHIVNWELPGKQSIYFGGRSNLISYIGHNGLMDFELGACQPGDSSAGTREVIILACYSKNYFQHYLSRSGARPLLWSTHLMAPEAYVLHDTLREWCAGKSNNEVRNAAAKAYSKYQKCSEAAARKLLVTEQ